jgi:hypothetical protein
VNRGGSWNNDAANCRTANRNTNDPTNRTNNNGFRLALNSAGKEVIALSFCPDELPSGQIGPARVATPPMSAGSV